jgi:hypothetical protein
VRIGYPFSAIAEADVANGFRAEALIDFAGCRGSDSTDAEADVADGFAAEALF